MTLPLWESIVLVEGGTLATLARIPCPTRGCHSHPVTVGVRTAAGVSEPVLVVDNAAVQIEPSELDLRAASQVLVLNAGDLAASGAAIICPNGHRHALQQLAPTVYAVLRQSKSTASSL